eukprot:gnl/TRDRNA2_/TRDRNA2_73855_c0_seq1.p1 gnl/TRDRNA2_/TRDRNA2_73855_c0~~gnl/TRDRNA2_/TRDRNA2_73855_c0_seq1.p1  ORF type:complete len:371 (-),score=44.31 gnl/TRDRNA2_/TRDRNA2_73855_c0_seq1:68-1180(-)
MAAAQRFPSSINTLQLAVDELLNADLQHLGQKVAAHDLQQLVFRVNACLEHVSAQVSNKRATDAEQPAIVPAQRSAMFALTQPSLVAHILHNADAVSLMRVRAVGSQWRDLGSSPKLWQNIVAARWPGTEALPEIGLASGCFMSLFWTWCKVERKHIMPRPDFTSIMSRIDEARARRKAYYDQYALLVRLSDADGLFFDCVFDLHLVSLHEEGEKIQGRPALEREFRRSVDFHLDGTSLSLTVFRRTDCRCFCVCSRATEPEQEVFEPRDSESWRFTFKCHVPRDKRGFFESPPYYYKCLLDEADWCNRNDMDDLHIKGFKRLTLWCERDQLAEDLEFVSRQQDDDPPWFFGRLKELWRMGESSSNRSKA